jgi:hypothetical protein
MRPNGLLCLVMLALAGSGCAGVPAQRSALASQIPNSPQSAGAAQLGGSTQVAAAMPAAGDRKVDLDQLMYAQSAYAQAPQGPQSPQ